MSGPGHIHETRRIRRLDDLENFFLEVLTPHFTLIKQRKGCKLSLDFSDASLTIWGDAGKREVLAMIPDFDRRSREIQRELEGLIHRGQPRRYRHDDPAFPFRYASGGALPLVRYRGSEYYCFFYRDIFPLGWNIANGGSDSRYELLAPEFTIERELREEIMAVDTKRRLWYVLQAYPQEPMDMPEFKLARRLWQEYIGKHDIAGFDRQPVPLKWLDGPDTLEVRDRESLARTVSGVFLNVNATDFGIEVDRVAHIALDDDVRLLDGEINRMTIIDRLIGLFPVADVLRRLRKGRGPFVPDIVFHSGKRYEKGKRSEPEMCAFVAKRVVQYIRRLESMGLRPSGAAQEWQEKSDRARFGLCPVTDGILRRHCKLSPAGPTARVHLPEVFISYGGSDEKIALTVFEFLRRKRIKTFFAPKQQETASFTDAINDALEEARIFLAVGTTVKNLNRPGPTFERGRFNSLMLRNRDKIALSFVSFDPRNLPAPLDQFVVVRFKRDNVEDRLNALLTLIRSALRSSP